MPRKVRGNNLVAVFSTNLASKDWVKIISINHIRTVCSKMIWIHEKPLGIYAPFLYGFIGIHIPKGGGSREQTERFKSNRLNFEDLILKCGDDAVFAPSIHRSCIVVLYTLSAPVTTPPPRLFSTCTSLENDVTNLPHSDGRRLAELLFTRENPNSAYYKRWCSLR